MSKALEKWIRKHPRLLARLCSLSDWHYDVGGILGLSIATELMGNLLNNGSTDPVQLLLIICWAFAGASALRCGAYIRAENEVYWRLRAGAPPDDKVQSFRDHLSDKIAVEPLFPRIAGATVISIGLALIVSLTRLRGHLTAAELSVVIEGLSRGARYFLVGFSFMLILGVARFLNISLAAVVAVGAFVAWKATDLHLSFALAAALGITAGGVVGLASELLVFRSARRRGANPLIALLASLGLYTVLQNLLSVGFGDQPRPLFSGLSGVTIGTSTFKVSALHAVTIGSSLAVWLLASFLFARTSLGIVIRAVAEDPELAAVKGISTNRVIFIVFTAASMVAGLAGIAIGIDSGVSPTMGFQALLMGMVAGLLAKPSASNRQVGI